MSHIRRYLTRANVALCLPFARWPKGKDDGNAEKMKESSIVSNEKIETDAQEQLKSFSRRSNGNIS